MNRQKTLLISGVAVLSVTALMAIAVSGRLSTNDQTFEQQTISSSHTPATKQSPTSISYVAEPGISSLAQLKKEAGDVVTQQSTYGEYVDSIEGKKGGDGGAYWSFYVDGEMSNIGAGTYIQKGGEEIMWKFQKL